MFQSRVVVNCALTFHFHLIQQVKVGNEWDFVDLD